MSIYSVVEFEDGIQLVPNSWIRGKHAFWPTYTNQIKINKAIAEADEPLSNWPLHKILRILASADNHREGIEKLKMGEAVSDIDSDYEKLKKSRHNRARKVILDDTSDEETEPTGRDIELPLPPKSINLVTKSTVPTSKHNIQGCTSSTYLQYTPTSTINENAQDNIFEKNVFNEEPTKIPEKDKITNIIIRKLNLINIKLDLLSQSIRNSQHEDITKDGGGFEFEFPLQNLKELEDLEQKLNDINFFNSLLKYLKGLGKGNTMSDVTTKILKKIFTNQLITQFTFGGKRTNKQCFKNLSIHKIILKVVRLHYSEGTEEDINKTIEKWLIQGSLRRARELARQNNEKDKIII